MEQTETLFGYDSLSILKILKVLSTSADPERERFLIGLRLADDILSAANLSVDKKIVFISTLVEGLKKDLNLNTETNLKINQYYREIGKFANDFLFETPPRYSHILNSRRNSMGRIFNRIMPKVLTLGQQDFFNQLIASYIHMSINRLFFVDQKKYEYMIYVFLLKSSKTEKNHFVKKT